MMSIKFISVLLAFVSLVFPVAATLEVPALTIDLADGLSEAFADGSVKFYVNQMNIHVTIVTKAASASLLSGLGHSVVPLAATASSVAASGSSVVAAGSYVMPYSKAIITKSASKLSFLLPTNASSVFLENLNAAGIGKRKPKLSDEVDAKEIVDGDLSSFDDILQFSDNEMITEYEEHSYPTQVIGGLNSTHDAWVDTRHRVSVLSTSEGNYFSLEKFHEEIVIRKAASKETLLNTGKNTLPRPEGRELYLDRLLVPLPMRHIIPLHIHKEVPKGYWFLGSNCQQFTSSVRRSVTECDQMYNYGENWRNNTGLRGSKCPGFAPAQPSLKRIVDSQMVEAQNILESSEAKVRAKSGLQMDIMVPASGIDKWLKLVPEPVVKILSM